MPLILFNCKTCALFFSFYKRQRRNWTVCNCWTSCCFYSFSGAIIYYEAQKVI